jgi:cytochrome d ubiquinol oxidase subunit I
VLWIVMLAFPFPYIANTAGWLTAELGRQPWLVYGLLRTREGVSPLVHPGSALFTLIGFAGIYLVLGLLFTFLVIHEVERGPVPREDPPREGVGPAHRGTGEAGIGGGRPGV